MGEMSEPSDAELLRDYAERRNEAAFRELVTRHADLVYSAALRQVESRDLAGDVAQTVFADLARKARSVAGQLAEGASLVGWLYRGTRFAALNQLRADRRRLTHERQAMEQLLTNSETAPDWERIRPLLDEAMASLGNEDRDAVLLRYFKRQEFRAVGGALGLSDDAAQKRVSRAVERLREFFAQRGVTLTGAAIAGAVSANAVQAVPVGLATKIAANALAAGAITTGTIAALSWLNAKAIAAVLGFALVAGMTVYLVQEGRAKRLRIEDQNRIARQVQMADERERALAAAKLASHESEPLLVTNAMERPAEALEQSLDDGSLLVLNRVSFDGKGEFAHGNVSESTFGNAIPAEVMQASGSQLARATQTFESPQGKSQLVAEFKLISSDAANHPLVKPAFYREFRCVIHGDSGIEYAQEFWPGKFQQYSDGYFGYIVANRFPRDSQWLWLRVERRERQDQGGPWKSAAEFKIKNGATSVIQPWVADPPGVAKGVEGLDFELGEITVGTQPYGPRDIWNHVVTVSFQVSSNGLVLTNWGTAYVRVEDASGNWDYNLASHRSLDPRFVWKLEADFEPVSDYPVEATATVELPRASSTFTTNFLDLPVTISWDGYWVDVNMPTNRQDIALRFVCVAEDEGEKTSEASGSWNQHFFRKGSFMWHKGGVLSVGGLKATTMTFAIVPNIHATFYAQPRLVAAQVKD